MTTKAYINNAAIAEKLNLFLSDLQVYYQNLRGFHWLVKGPQFYQLHSLFEKFYDEAAEQIDEVAERILMIGGVPLHTFSAYLEYATLSPAANMSDPGKILPVVIGNTEHLLAAARDIAAAAGNAADEGTVALMSDLIAGAEKKLWMLNSLIPG
jgi:starvation-inducible DNA-binding protein